MAANEPDSMRIEELVAVVQSTLAEGRPLSELEEPIQAVLEVTEVNLERFLEDTQNDPEMPAETREKLREALEDCLDSLEGIQDALPEGNEAVRQSVQETLECVQLVRKLQLDHQASLAEGPTSFAFVNRLLVQAARGDGQRVQSLLQDRFAFLQLLREELALRTLGPRDSQVLFDLQAVLDRKVSDLPAFSTDLLAAAGRLQPLLSRPAQTRPGGFLTVLGVERLAQLLKEYQGKPEEGVEAALASCRTAVRQSVPPSAPPAALQALSKLLAHMDLLEEDLQDQVVDLRAHSETLLALGKELEAALVVAPVAQDFRPESEGLPILFRSVLEPAYALLEGGGDSGLVFAAAQHLQTMLDQMEESQPEPSEDLEEALQVLSEAIEALQAVAGTGGPIQLEMASDLCREAADKLKAAGIRLK